MNERVRILDSTLREGEQCPGVSFTNSQRLQIAWALDYFGVDAIEISPIISNQHREACKTMNKAGFRAEIVAHVRALPEDIDVALACDASSVAAYHSVSDIHLKHKLKVSREIALERAVKTVEYAKAHGLTVRFTLEDASRADPKFLQDVAMKISEAGVDRISIPDTVGIMLPSGMYNLVRIVKEVVDTLIDVHCHNDLGLAVANSLAGMEAGASQIHTTIDGLGERVGIASLAEVSTALTIAYKMKMNLKLETLRELSETVQQYAGLSTPPSKPIVGDNAYKHKAGTHLAGVIREPSTYEIIPPSAVGNRRRLVFGELIGKSGALFLLKALGLELGEEAAAKLAGGFKRLMKGDLFELPLDEGMERQILEVQEQVQSSAKDESR